MNIATKSEYYNINEEAKIFWKCYQVFVQFIQELLQGLEFLIADYSWIYFLSIFKELLVRYGIYWVVFIFCCFTLMDPK